MAFVVTAGQIQTVQRPEATWASGAIPQYVRLNSSLFTTYEALWKTQPALRTVVGFLARNVAQLGVDVYRKLSPTDREKAVDHPVARLLERPVPGSTWTKYRLLSHLMHELCIYDNAYLLKMRPERDVLALLPVPARMVSPRGGTWWAPARYRITGTAGFRDVDADQVVHLHGYNPADPRRGVSPIETLRQILAEEHAASQWREQLWSRGARMSGVLKRPASAPPWSTEARERFRASWRAQYSGDGADAGGTPVLEDGMEWMPAGVSPKDAQYVEARKLTREEVAVAYHVSPSMIGLTEGTNHSSMQALHRMLYQDTLAPWTTQIAQDLEAQLLEDVDPAAPGALYVEFNLSEKLRGSFAEQTQALQSAVGAPWMTRAEARAMFNLADVNGADELIVPLNVVAGGLASPRDTAPDTPRNGATGPKAAATAVLRRLRQRQRRTVLSEVGAGAFTGLDRPRWDRELTADLAAAGIAAPAAAALVARAGRQTHDTLTAALAARQPDEDPRDVVRCVFDLLDDLTPEEGDE